MKTPKSSHDPIVATFMPPGIHLVYDTDKVRAVSIEYYGHSPTYKPKLLYRPLNKREKLEIISTSLCYCRRGILYWAFRSLILWFTKAAYPQQGCPKKSQSYK